MVHDRANWRMKTRRAALALTAAALPFACLGGSAVHAQSIMRSPNLNIGSRIPSINPTAPRIDPNIAGRRLPDRQNDPNRSAPDPACSYAYRDSDGECRDQPATSADGGGGGGASAKNKQQAARAATLRRPRSTCARSPANSWPRSTARCPTRRPMNWRGVTASCASDRRIFR